MATGGYGGGGASAAGPTSLFLSLPFQNYRSQGTWLEEFADAMGIAWDVWQAEFISAAARTNLLDPTFTPPQGPASFRATATAAPTSSPIKDTMLDMLAYMAGVPWPMDSNLTIAQKQALVQAMPAALRRKGNRQQLLNVATAITGGFAYGWTSPPYGFAIIIGDGTPSPGWGSWTPTAAAQAGTVATTNGSAVVTGTSTAFLSGTASPWIGYGIIINGLRYDIASIASPTSLTLTGNATATVAGKAFSIIPGNSFRPWIMQTARNVGGRIYPAWAAGGSPGVGYSQFRAGYSAAGEPVFASGARLGLLLGEHFSAWTGSVPNSWTAVGSIVRNRTVAQISQEFTSSAAQIDQTVQVAGTVSSLAQSTTINNQLTHRLEVDYAYNPGATVPQVATLGVQITDLSTPATTYYYNATAQTWGTTSFTNYLSPTTTATTRTRYAVDVVPQADSTTTIAYGTSAIKVTVTQTSDGTASTQQIYTIYRVGLFEKYILSVEKAALGERTAWYPLRDALGWTTLTRTATLGVVEAANADQSQYKIVPSSGGVFPYHPAVSGRGFQSTAGNTNLVQGNDIWTVGGGWTFTNCSATLASVVSPIVGETTPSAPTLTASATNCSVSQAGLSAAPNGLPFTAGVWVKKLSADNVFTDVTLTLSSAGKGSYSKVFTLKQSDGWKRLSTSIVFAAGDTGSVGFKIGWGAAVTNGQIAVANAYTVQLLNGNTTAPNVPVVQTAAGVNGVLNGTSLFATTSSQGANVLSPLLLRSLISMTRGSISMTVVPNTPWPNTTNFFFDASGTLGTPRISLQIQAGAGYGTLYATMVDTNSVQVQASLTTTSNIDPDSTHFYWDRDVPITIRMRWDTSGVYLSAGSASVNQVNNNGNNWTPGETLLNFGIGTKYDTSFPFEGLIRDFEVLNVGAPIT